jgi:hypothetical protein
MTAVWDTQRIHARLAEAAQADPDLDAFGASRHRYRLASVLREEQIAAFEARHDITLPEPYRSFLSEAGDGGAGPYYGLFRLDGSDMDERDRDESLTPGFLATPFPHTERWNPNHSWPCETWMEDDEYFDPQWVTGSLVLAHFGCGAFYRLVVTGAARGQVWFDDRASDAGLAPDATDFGEWYLRWFTTLPMLEPTDRRGPDPKAAKGGLASLTAKFRRATHKPKVI